MKNAPTHVFRALRRYSRGATQLCFRFGKHALPHTDDMRRLDNGGGARRCLLVSFRSALRSPFASSARTAVPLSAVPFAVPRGCYSSPSQVSLRKEHTILFSPCQAVNLYFDCFLARSDRPGFFGFFPGSAAAGTRLPKKSDVKTEKALDKLVSVNYNAICG